MVSGGGRVQLRVLGEGRGVWCCVDGDGVDVVWGWFEKLAR